MNSFNNTLGSELTTEVHSNALLISYDEWEQGYVPSEVWIVAPPSSKWTIDNQPSQLISDINGSVLREDGKVEARLDGMYLNNKSVVLSCTSADTVATWTYLDINFPIYNEDGTELSRYSLGWNIKTRDD